MNNSDDQGESSQPPNADDQGESSQPPNVFTDSKECLENKDILTPNREEEKKEEEEKSFVQIL